MALKGWGGKKIKQLIVKQIIQIFELFQIHIFWSFIRSQIKTVLKKVTELLKLERYLPDLPPW